MLQHSPEGSKVTSPRASKTDAKSIKTAQTQKAIEDLGIL